MMRIEQYLHDSAKRLGSKTAIVSGETRLTYEQLYDLSSRLSRAIGELEVGEGDRVLLLLDNGWELAVSVFGSWLAGAVICLVNPSTKALRLQQIARDCEPALVIVEKRLERLIDTIEELKHLPRLVSGEGGGFHRARELDPRPMQERSADQLAALIYTSGSTGVPKGVMLAHDNLHAAVKSITSYLENSADDVILVVLPMSFGYGLNQLLTSVRAGATLVIEKSFAYPQQIFETIRQEGVTGWPIVPSMAAIMMQSRDLKSEIFAGLRYITSAAAPLPLTHQDWLRDTVPDAALFIMYGQTECTRAAYLPPNELDRRRGSTGIAIPGTVVKITDDEGRAVASGTVGELLVSGPHVMRGYWRNEDATRRALHHDHNTGEVWLRTGDLFTADADGFLTFVSRMDDVIKCRGEKVAPRMVEEVLCRMPGISEAVALGVPHDLLGQAIKAVLVCSGGNINARDVQRFSAQYLEDHMVPKIVEFRTELPKTPSGKISRRLLIEPEQTAE